MQTHTIQEAARLAEASYKGNALRPRKARAHRRLKQDIKDSCTTKGADAHYMNNGVLLIPGSNSLMDYLRYNLRVLKIGGKRYKMSDTATGEDSNGNTWHQGFLAHAKIILDWVEEKHEVPKFIIGHSLGAAATQILCKNWNVPGIAFAAPRPRRHADNGAGKDLCLCINRHDDAVGSLPPSFHHMGKVVICTSRSSPFRSEHPMKHYRSAVAEHQARGKLAKSWPS